MTDDDRTVIMSPGGSPPPPPNNDNGLEGSIQITLVGPFTSTLEEILFARSFTIGRSEENDLSIVDAEVSRNHVEIIKDPTAGWMIRDLDSTNGSFIDDKQISYESLPIPCVLRLGKSDTFVYVEPPGGQSALSANVSPKSSDDVTQIVTQDEKTKIRTPSPSPSGSDLPSREEVIRRYLSDDGGEAGEYTQIVRQVIREDNKKKTGKYKWVLGVVAFLLVGSIAMVTYQQNQLSTARDLAINIFYDMKTLEVDLVKTELQLKKSNDDALLATVDKKRVKLKKMRERYSQYIDELGILDVSSLSKNRDDWLILKVARDFGECDIDLPPGFVDEVKKYIRYWQHSPRMRNAMSRLYDNGYETVALDALKKEGLPPQFLYLSMQESNFNAKAIGPRTRWGIAKGAWQFIPTTATEFGLKIGPLSGTRVYDPDDERHDFGKAAGAAARYLKEIYSTEAQASGLLVMAGYNWGHNRVKKLIRKMPDNPRERNFWQLIQTYKIPDETYNYVFYIFSAAVIAEDPKFFGFEFKSPTAGIPN